MPDGSCSRHVATVRGTWLAEPLACRQADLHVKVIIQGLRIILIRAVLI